MVALKAHEVGRFIDRPDIEHGIFLAYGPDAGLVRETGQRLARRFAGSDADSMNLIVLDGAELDADPSRLAVEARTTSLFGDRRVIRVRGAGKSLVMALTELADDVAGAAIVLEAGNLLPKDALRAMVEAARLGRALPCYPDNDEALGRLGRDLAILKARFFGIRVAIQPAEERFAGFLRFRFHGNMGYIESRGHPRLRGRHLPFAIGGPERDRWLEIMKASIEETAIAAPAAGILLAFFAQVADFMRNQPTGE